jgi:hypothetical protein
MASHFRVYPHCVQDDRKARRRDYFLLDHLFQQKHVIERFAIHGYRNNSILEMRRCGARLPQQISQA